jgi:aromatic ring-opening dioxygenase LigB subunit
VECVIRDSFSPRGPGFNTAVWRAGFAPPNMTQRKKSAAAPSRRVATERLAQRILVVRGHRVIIDADLATLYGVTTKALNQSVRRNRDRFPDEFLFVLTGTEKLEVVTNCDHLRQLRFSKALPTAFTEHGAIMAATVLKSKRAVEMSVFVVRAFVELREILSRNKDLARALAELERRVARHDKEITSLVEVVRQLALALPQPRRGIGFTADLGK